jgi:hypothetical protein
LREAGLNLHVPYGLNSGVLQGWSSFPSDHAAFFFALSVIFFFVCRRAGIFAFLYSVIVICLPRVYLGIHYPTDLLAGAMIGTGISCLALIAPLRMSATRPVLRYFDANPSVSYGCLSVLMYLIGTVCEPVPKLIHFAFGTVALCLARIGHPLHATFGTQSIVEPLIALTLAVAILAMLAVLCKRFFASNPKMIVSPVNEGQRNPSLAATSEQSEVALHHLP